MRRPNIYRELNRRISPRPARELKINWHKIEREDNLDPWEEELVEESSPWELAFEKGAEMANDDVFDMSEDFT